jgi:hypothetical protein
MRKPFLTGLPISRGLKPTKVAMAAIAMLSAAECHCDCFGLAASRTDPGPAPRAAVLSVIMAFVAFWLAPPQILMV